MTAVEYSSDRDGSYRFRFKDAPPEISSTARWYSDLAQFFRENPINGKVTDLFLDTRSARSPTASFNVDRRDGSSNLSLNDFPHAQRAGYDSHITTGSAHEVFHWFNEFLRQNGQEAKAWPSQRIRLSSSDMKDFPTTLHQFKPSPFARWARRDLQGYFDVGYLLEEVGAYAFQALAESEIVHERGRSVLAEHPESEGRARALLRIPAISAQRIDILAQESLRRYDMHVIFAQSALSTYEKLLKELTSGGVGMQLVENQIIELELKNTSKIEVIYSKNIRQLYAEFQRDPQALTQALVIATAKTLLEARNLTRELGSLARRILPVFETIYKAQGETTLKNTGGDGPDVKLSELITFLRGEATVIDGSRTVLYQFPQPE
jgi:hypothetical protein